MKVYVGAYLEIRLLVEDVVQGTCLRNHSIGNPRYRYCPICGGKIIKTEPVPVYLESVKSLLPEDLPAIEEITPKTSYFDRIHTIIAIGASSVPNGVWDAYESGDPGTIALPEDGMAEKLKREFALSYAKTINYLRRSPSIKSVEVHVGIIINPPPERLHDPYEGSDW